MGQLIPVPLTVSCSRKSRLVLPFWYRLIRVTLMSSSPENQLALVALPGRLDSGSMTPTLGKPGGRLNMGEGDASSISVASSWSSLGTGDSSVIQGGMNLVWTTRAPFLRMACDWVFCNGAANEGVAGADTHVTAASGLCTREPRFAGGETDEARSGAAEAYPARTTRCRL